MRKHLRALALLIAFLLACPTATLAEGSAFTYRHGSLDEPRIAITVDDCFSITQLVKILDLCDQYQIKITVFPMGKKLKAEDRAVWQRVIDSGHELGSHTTNHRNLTNLTGYQIRAEMNGMQQRLNAALGYEYPLTLMRPPYGQVGEAGGSSHAGRELYKLGYHALILWNVSNVNPKVALKQTKNGSILLFHTNAKDYNCLVTLIPALIEKGFELVTVSELLHLDKNGDPIPADATTSPSASASAQTTPATTVSASAKATATPTASATAKATASPTASASAKAITTAIASASATPIESPTPTVSP